TVRLIASDKNRGFACGNNRGIASSRGRLILLLNPDAFLTDPTVLEKTANWLDTHSDYAGLGCKLIFPDGKHQVGDAGYAPTPLSVVMHAFGLTRLIPGARGVFLNPARRKPVQAIDVDWICGAFFLIRRSVIDEVGGLNEQIFMYGED